MKKFLEVSNEDFIAHGGIYEKFILEDYLDERNKLGDLISKRLTIDCYCKECKNYSTFIRDQKEISTERDEKLKNVYKKIKEYSSVSSDIKELDYFTIQFHCCRNENHTIFFTFKICNNNEMNIMKIGQYPSIADLALYDISKYSRYISEEDFSDLKRAIGLSAHGIGSGAFVYLRRIFESFVKKAYERCKSEGHWNSEDDFYKIDMKKKIDNLKEYLPKFLYQNPIIYSILSAGIHNLDEAYCKENFQILKEAVLVMLDEEMAKKEEEKRKERLEKNIQKLNSDISTKVKKIKEFKV